jgi:hypothetical protein
VYGDVTARGVSLSVSLSLSLRLSVPHFSDCLSFCLCLSPSLWSDCLFVSLCRSLSLWSYCLSLCLSLSLSLSVLSDCLSLSLDLLSLCLSVSSSLSVSLVLPSLSHCLTVSLSLGLSPSLTQLSSSFLLLSRAPPLPFLRVHWFVPSFLPSVCVYCDVPHQPTTGRPWGGGRSVATAVVRVRGFDDGDAVAVRRRLRSAALPRGLHIRRQVHGGRHWPPSAGQRHRRHCRVSE